MRTKKFFKYLFDSDTKWEWFVFIHQAIFKRHICRWIKFVIEIYETYFPVYFYKSENEMLFHTNS